MSKRVILYRHGKSDWNTSLDDLSRPLAERGRDAAEHMGRLLANANQVPDVVICSTAVRAKQTLECSMASGQWACDVQYSDGLYLGSCNALLTVIREQSDHIHSVMLVGHEPTWSEMVSRLIGGGEVAMPTAAMARIDLMSACWDEADFGCGHLRWLLQPKLFSGANA